MAEKKSNYKNELGTISSERNIKISNFITEQNKKGIFETTDHISDFEEQESEIMLNKFLSWYKAKQSINTFNECSNSYIISEFKKVNSIK